MARKKRFVGEYSPEDLARLSPSYRKSILRELDRSGPFGLISDARRHGPRTKKVVRDTNLMYQRFGPPNSLPVSKANARNLFANWVVRTQYAPRSTSKLYSFSKNPITGEVGVSDTRYYVPQATAQDPNGTIVRAVMDAPLPKGEESDGIRTYGVAFEFVWSQAVATDKRSGGSLARRALMSLFYDNAILADLYSDGKYLEVDNARRKKVNATQLINRYYRGQVRLLNQIGRETVRNSGDDLASVPNHPVPSGASGDYVEGTPWMSPGDVLNSVMNQGDSDDAILAAMDEGNVDFAGDPSLSDDYVNYFFSQFDDLKFFTFYH